MDCNICDHVFIENKVVIHNRVTVKCGVQLWDGVYIEDDVFVGPNVTFTNDAWPRSRQWLSNSMQTIIHEGASIGANATILPGIIVGAHAMIGAGAVVTESVPPYAVVVGNPARITRYVSSEDATPNPGDASRYSQGEEVIANVRLGSIRIVNDERGNLGVAEFGDGLPFWPLRFFFIYDVPAKEVRGAHAHKECHQLLICLKGSVSCLVDNGHERAECLLDRPDKALHVPPMTWGTQYNFSEDAVLLVAASHLYDVEDYIRNYDAFLETIS